MDRNKPGKVGQRLRDRNKLAKVGQRLMDRNKPGKENLIDMNDRTLKEMF